MEWVTSTVKPNEIVYQPMPNGKAFVMLRKDIQQTQQSFQTTEGEQSQEVWIYHEKQFFTQLTEAEVKERFDDLYLTAGMPAPELKDEVSNLSDMVCDLMDRVDALEGSDK